MKEQCHLYCDCFTGWHDEELSEVKASKNVCFGREFRSNWKGSLGSDFEGFYTI